MGRGGRSEGPFMSVFEGVWAGAMVVILVVSLTQSPLAAGAGGGNSDISARSTGAPEREKAQAVSVACVGWRQTGNCSPDGPRERHLDRACADVVSGIVSGYCECDVTRTRQPRPQRVRAGAVSCGHSEFTCAEVCAKQLPGAVEHTRQTRGAVAPKSSSAKPQTKTQLQQHSPRDDSGGVQGQATVGVDASVGAHAEVSAGTGSRVVDKLQARVQGLEDRLDELVSLVPIVVQGLADVVELSATVADISSNAANFARRTNTAATTKFAQYASEASTVQASARLSLCEFLDVEDSQCSDDGALLMARRLRQSLKEKRKHSAPERGAATGSTPSGEPQVPHEARPTTTARRPKPPAPVPEVGVPDGPYDAPSLNLSQLQTIYESHKQDFQKLAHMNVHFATTMPRSVLHSDPKSFARANELRNAFIHAWKGYEAYAWGSDELMPVSKSAGKDPIGMGLTIIDSLDTMILMGMPNAYSKAREWVASHLDVGKQRGINLFETTIRVLGGLLSAYDLSQDTMYLLKAQEVADKLLFAFDSPSGIPYGTLDLDTKKAYNPGHVQHSSCIAEVMTLQLEFMYLSHHTRDTKYRDACQRIMDVVRAAKPDDSLFPMFISPKTGKFVKSTITLGARSDSSYEYLLKQWLLVGPGTDQDNMSWVKQLYDDSLRSILTQLVRKSTPSNLSYVAERTTSGSLKHKMDHLVCFVPGMMALGAQHADRSNTSDVAWNLLVLEEAKQLASTCFQMYVRQATKLAPEIVQFTRGQDFAPSTGATHSMLRPETVESLFVLWRVTKDEAYRDMGWQIFQAIQDHAKVGGGGYTGLKDVNNVKKGYDDKMQTFFLAETLKYLYLMFLPDDVISLDHYVFNTEAHPLSVFT